MREPVQRRCPVFREQVESGSHESQSAALLVGMLLLGATRAGATTYAVSEFESGGDIGVAIGGSVTTDGTLGPLNFFNILDWNLIGTAVNGPPPTVTAFFDLTPANSRIGNIVNVTATANTLTLGLASGVIIPNGDLFFTNEGSATIETIEFTAEPPAPELMEPAGTEFTVCNRPQAVPCATGLSDSLTFADGKVIATTTPPPAVPLPGTLPLFASGLGALGLLGWRRKRKLA